ncbi:MAG: OmpA family protein [bacterium]|nr:OmpA family protein [bacterium]
MGWYSRAGWATKLLFWGAIGVVAYLGIDRYLVELPGHKVIASVVPEKVDLPGGEVASVQSSGPVRKFPLPSSQPANLQGPEVKLLGYAWNAQMGLLYAIGGANDGRAGIVTSRGSIMEKHGIKFRFIRQDDNSKLRGELVLFASEVARGVKHPTVGTNFIAFMGDFAPTFLKDINDELIKRLGPDYSAEAIWTNGSSCGEDKYMDRPEVKIDPQKAKGSIIATVVKDGDWNIVVKWAGDNKIHVNPDWESYDPEAINFWNAPDYMTAAKALVAGQQVTLRHKKTGKMVTLPITGMASWTPADELVAKKKGGLAVIASTRDYYYQMANLVVGIKKWNRDNADLVVRCILASSEAGDQIKNFPDALDRAAEISNLAYDEADTGPGYWKKYFQGVTEMDAKGMLVQLGGSRVHNLADNLHLFGLPPYSRNIYADVYGKFGRIMMTMYPKDVPNIYPVDQVVNTTYLRMAAEKVQHVAEVERPKVSSAPMVSEVVSRRSWNIEFNTNEATLTAAAEKLLRDEVLPDITMTSMVLELHGHTDISGDRDYNYQLSRNRAEAVKRFFMANARGEFNGRIKRTEGHGPDQPVADNSTEYGRTQNRRVEIVMGH